MRKPTLRALLPGLIPFFGMCFTVSFRDLFHPVVAGLPFNFFRLIPWILLAALCLRNGYRFETRADLQRPDGPQRRARWNLPPPHGC